MRQTRQRRVNTARSPQEGCLPLGSHPQVHVERRGHVTVYVNTSRWGQQSLEELFRLPSELEKLPGSSSRSPGRTTLWHWTPRRGDGPGLVVRQFVHGGILAPLTGTWFWGSRRMEREMSVALRATEEGLPTARAVALRTERTWGPFYTGYLLTEHIPDSVNLLQLCQRVENGYRLGTARRRQLARDIADALAQAHDAGLDHADLNLKNVLVQHPWDEPRVFIIDLDKARMRSTLPLEDRVADLVRLDRSVLKWPASRSVINLTDRLRVWKRYMNRQPQWGLSWKDLLRRHKTRHARHALSRR